MKSTCLPAKHLFDIPAGIIYLDGNSLGPLPLSAVERMKRVILDEWGHQLIRAWNSSGWMDLPQRVGSRIARLIGAPANTVATGDTLSIKVYQALTSALQMRQNRYVILSDNGNFPTDLYIAQGLIEMLGGKYELKLVAPHDVIDAMDDTVAAVMLTHVDYRTGRMYDMSALTQATHAAGAVMVWDLAHSAGAVPLDLEACKAEFAVGCTYKYLNGGPGSPAFIYVRSDLIENVRPALAGWMGHEAPFAMDLTYRPAMSTERMRVGTPPVVQLSILDSAIDIWDNVDMVALRSASLALADLFIKEIERRCPVLVLMTPREPMQRGSHVSFAFPHSYAAMQALIDRGVIGDFRAPDIMRFGITPLYIDAEDIKAAAALIAEVINDRLWDNAAYRKRQAVT